MIDLILKILPRKAKKRLVKTLVLSFFSSGLELLSLSLIIPIIYIVINPNNELILRINEYLNLSNFLNVNTYYLLTSLLILIFIIKTIYLSFFINYQLIFKRNLRNNLAQLLFSKYLKLQYLEISKKSFAEMQKNIDSETLRFSELVISYTMFLNELVMGFTIILFLFFFNFNVTLILTIIFLFIFLFLYFSLEKKFRLWGVKGQESFKNYNDTIIQSFNNLREIKLQGSENNFIKDFSSENKLKNFYEYNHRLYSVLPRYYLELLAVLLIFLILFIMMRSNLNTDYILATIGLYAYASVRLLPILNKLLNLIAYIKYHSNSASIILNEMNLLDKNFQINNRNDIEVNNIDSIELKEICFAYGAKHILKNLSIKFEKGQVIGISGPSGSGKSTLLDILTSLIIPDSGKVLINKKEFDPKKNFWGKKISYISQSTDLFNRSIGYNISFGKNQLDIDKKKMEFALNSSNLTTFIKNLPQGINTVVGEKGSFISTGQKQRINIARAFYNNVKVLILDESTNSLDFENEKKIFSDIVKIKNNLIVIIVSHKKKLLENYCDKIYHLNDLKLHKI